LELQWDITGKFYLAQSIFLIGSLLC
jgi:hypothetical protein